MNADLFGNFIKEPAKQPAKKTAPDPVSLPLQPIPPLERVNTPIRPIAYAIREGQITTIWHHE